MNTTTGESPQDTAENRLAGVGRRTDGVVAKARDSRHAIDGRVSSRVDVLRAKEAQTRSQVREFGESEEAASDAYFDELDLELYELDIEMMIVDAQVDAELAAEEAAFEQAVSDELDAWDRRIDRLDAQAAQAAQAIPAAASRPRSPRCTTGATPPSARSTCCARRHRGPARSKSRA